MVIWLKNLLQFHLLLNVDNIQTFIGYNLEKSENLYKSNLLLGMTLRYIHIGLNLKDFQFSLMYPGTAGFTNFKVMINDKVTISDKAIYYDSVHKWAFSKTPGTRDFNTLKSLFVVDSILHATCIIT